MGDGSDVTRRPTTLSGSTWIPLGKVAAIAVFAASAAVWATRVDNRLQRIEDALIIRDAQWIERWRVEAWVRMFKQANPTLPIPDLIGSNG